ncbi:MAG: sigma-70 family RNA polymerase sigma factor [Prosthecobacter sp.]|nr:sigma-70 family RNA polymerase sigma factor [Prosthecobacter sp.]
MNLNHTLDAIFSGEPDAFLAIVRDQGPSLRTWLGTQLFHQDEVEDLAQEVFITAYRKLPDFRRGEDFGAWLRGIARNKLLKHYERIRKRESALELFRRESAALLHDELEAAASRTKETHLQALLGCIRKLPERMRKVVRGWLDGTRAAALVEELQLSTANIYQIQHRACELLRGCIEQELAHAD